jgi:hypothetical protein
MNQIQPVGGQPLRYRGSGVNLTVAGAKHHPCIQKKIPGSKSANHRGRGSGDPLFTENTNQAHGEMQRLLPDLEKEEDIDLTPGRLTQDVSTFSFLTGIFKTISLTFQCNLRSPGANTMGFFML